VLNPEYTGMLTKVLFIDIDTFVIRNLDEVFCAPRRAGRWLASLVQILFLKTKLIGVVCLFGSGGAAAAAGRHPAAALAHLQRRRVPGDPLFKLRNNAQLAAQFAASISHMP
jgi:hypothetical protein